LNYLRRNIILSLTAFYILLYTALFIFTGYEMTAFMLSSMIFGVAMIVLVTWSSTAYQAFRDGGREGEAILAFSICIVAAYAVYTRVWVVSKIALNNPEWMNTSPIGLASAVLLLIFFTGVLLAPNTRDGNVPTKNLIFWGAAIFLAGVFLGVSLGASLSRSDEPQAVPTLISPMRGGCEEPKPVYVKAYCRSRPNGL
jgi:hypothetical protein